MLARSIFSESLILACHVMISPILLLKVDSLLWTCFWTVGAFFGFLVVSLVLAWPPPPFWLPGSPSTGGMPGACLRSSPLRPMNLPISAPVAIFLKGSSFFWCGHVIVRVRHGHIYIATKLQDGFGLSFIKWSRRWDPNLQFVFTFVFKDQRVPHTDKLIVLHMWSVSIKEFIDQIYIDEVIHAYICAHMHTHTHLKLYGPPSQGNLDGSSSRL